MIGYVKIMKQINTLKDGEYLNIARLMDNAFIRKRKIDLPRLIAFILSKRGLTLKMEIDKFKELLNGEITDISESAICQQRQKLNPEIFKEMMKTYIEDTYDKDHDYDTYKGYLVFAIDGMKIELPNVKSLQKEFGNNIGRFDQRPCAMALTSSIYDVVNNMVIDSQIDKINASERKLAMTNIVEMINTIGDRIDLEKTIIIFDRGYPSLELVGFLDKLGIKYLFRLSKSIFADNVKAMVADDEITRLKITPSRLNSIRSKEIFEILSKKEYIESRLVKYKLSTDEIEILLTNIPEKDFNTTEIGELYYERWKIELAYNIAKNKLEIQNISGHSKLIVEQDFYAQMYLLNIAEDLRKEANKKVTAKKDNGYKYDYQVNMNILIGKMREKLINIIIQQVFFDAKDSDIKYQELITEISKNIVPIRPERTNPRKPYKTRNKYRCNMRRNS